MELNTKNKEKNEKSEADQLDFKAILNKQPHLSMQSYDTLESTLSPLTFEIMSRQATINIGIFFIT